MPYGYWHTTASGFICLRTTASEDIETVKRNIRLAYSSPEFEMEVFRIPDENMWLRRARASLNERGWHVRGCTYSVSPAQYPELNQILEEIRAIVGAMCDMNERGWYVRGRMYAVPSAQYPELGKILGEIRTIVSVKCSSNNIGSIGPENPVASGTADTASDTTVDTATDTTTVDAADTLASLMYQDHRVGEPLEWGSLEEPDITAR